MLVGAVCPRLTIGMIMINRQIEQLFTLSGYLAGIFLVIIGLLVVSQIVGRMIGIQLPSADEFAGYSLAATSFLGLAYSFRKGSHIRVTLLTDRLSKQVQRLMLVLALTFALVMIAFLTYNGTQMVMQSVEYNEMSSGLLRYPLWIPQSFMALGVGLFTLAILEDLVRVLRGQEPNFVKNKEQVETE